MRQVGLRRVKPPRAGLQSRAGNAVAIAAGPEAMASASSALASCGRPAMAAPQRWRAGRRLDLLGGGLPQRSESELGVVADGG